MTRILAAGRLVIPAWTDLIDQALLDFPESTLVYVHGDPAGELAADRWATAGLDFEVHDRSPASIILAHDLVSTVDVVLLCLEGWASFAQQVKSWALAAEVPVPVREVGGLVRPT